MTLISSLYLSLLFYASLYISFGLVVKRECSDEFRNSQEECPTIINFVCAYFTGGNCDSDLCQKLAVNECEACKDPSVQYFTIGPCESEKLYCDEKSRGLLPCDFEGNNDVCSYFTEGCLEPECALGSRSQCDACTDPTAIYYKAGYCNPDDQVHQCSESCDLTSNDFAICLFKSGCQGNDCIQTYSDVCTGCNANPGSSYKDGPCQKDRIICDSASRTENCQNADASPVCAYFNLFTSDGDIELHQATVNNACTACNDLGVSYYTQGQCEYPPNSSKYCLPGHAPVDCGDANEPVCGYKPFQWQDFAIDEFPNGCSACQNPNVTFYRPEKCSYTCPTYDFLDTDIVNCNGSLIDPICFYKQIFDFEEEESTGSADQGQIVEIDSVRYRALSIKNYCVACFDLSLSQEWGFYEKGLCPGDEGIYCANEANSYYYGTISPVCGLSTEECSDSSCRTTFSEPLAACNFSSSVLYTSGYCPGDQGISCELYREQSDQLCVGKNNYTIPVCGYTRADCGDNSCRTNYDNQCYACLESSVIFFTKGACEGES